jgi:hypothetical protein
MTARQKVARVRHLPRVPLPRQKGGAHMDKTRLPARKQKHKKPGGADDA